MSPSRAAVWAGSGISVVSTAMGIAPVPCSPTGSPGVAGGGCLARDQKSQSRSVTATEVGDSHPRHMANSRIPNTATMVMSWFSNVSTPKSARATKTSDPKSAATPEKMPGRITDGGSPDSKSRRIVPPTPVVTPRKTAAGAPKS